MKRFIVVVAILVLVTAGLSAQDLSGLGRDFEVVIEELGASLLPDLTQSAIWGQYPGLASYADQSNFFLTLSLGAILTDGLLGFVDDDEAFTVLNVPNLFRGILTSAGDERLTSLFEGMKTFFPVPVSRTSFGFTLPGEVEAMVGVGGFPQFVTGWVGGLTGADSLKLSMLHVGTKVRKGILSDTGRFPALSIGGGYSYSGFTVGYDLAALGEGTGGYGQVQVGLGELNVKGELLMRSRVHTFGLDFQASKALGFFVPYVGISPYYHLASFSGGVGAGGVFDAFVDYDGVAVNGVNRDVEYDGEAPATAWVSNDLSLVLFGGFDMIFGNTVFQVGSAWLVPTGSPGVTLSVRWQ